MTVGIIGGSNAALDFLWTRTEEVPTNYGVVTVYFGETPDGVSIALVPRHDTEHVYLSSQVNHRANITALDTVGVNAIVGTTVVGIIDPDMRLGVPIVFDEVFFPDNRLPDGKPCTFFAKPGETGRGHYVFDTLISQTVSNELRRSAAHAEIDTYTSGTYAYMLGPRFNTKSEIAFLAKLGMTAVSQTAAPEAVLAGELEIPYALIGFGTDYANGVMQAATPMDVLNENVAKSSVVFTQIISGAAHAISQIDHPADQGQVYRFE